MKINTLHNSIDQRLGTLSKSEKKLFLLNLITSLVRVQKIESCNSILLCYIFLKSKIIHLGVKSLIKDFEIVDKLKTSSVHQNSITELHSVFQQSAHLFEDKENSTPSILYGYLDEHFSDEIKTLKKQIVEQTDTMWLKALNSNLANQQPIIRTIETQSKGNTSLHISDDKSLIYIGSEDGLIQLWNSENYQLEYTFSDPQKKSIIRTIYDIGLRHILVVSEQKNDTILQKWNIDSKQIIAEVRYENKNDQYSLEQTHKFQISADKQWILTHGFEKGNSLILRNTENLNVVSTLNFEGLVIDFRFIELDDPKSWFDFFSGSKKSSCHSIVCVTGSDVYQDDIRVYSVSKKGRIHLMYKCLVKAFSNLSRGIHQRKNSQSFYYLSTDQTIEQYAFKNLEFIKRNGFDFQKETPPVEQIRVLPERHEFLLFLKNGDLIHWDEKENKAKTRQEVFNFVEFLDISSEVYFALSNGVQKTQLYSLDTGAFVQEIMHNSVYDSLKHITEQRFVSIEEHEFYIWNISSKRKSFQGNGSAAVNCIYRLNQDTWLIGTAEGELLGFKVKKDTLEHILSIEIEEQINHLSTFDADNTTYIIVSCGELVSEKKNVQIFDLKTHERRSVFEDHTGLIQESIKLPHSDFILSLSFDYTFRIWSYKSGEVFRTCFHTLNQEFTGMPVGVELVDNFLLVCSEELMTLRDLKTFDLMFEFPKDSMSIKSFACSDCKTQVASGYVNGYIKIWSLLELKEINVIKHRSNAITKLYWNTLPSNKFQLNHYLVSVDNKFVFIWNPDEATLFRKFLAPDTNDIVFFRNNQNMITASTSGKILIWDIIEDKMIFSCNIGRAIMKIDFDEQRQILIVGEYNGQVHFLKLKNSIN